MDDENFVSVRKASVNFQTDGPGAAGPVEVGCCMQPDKTLNPHRTENDNDYMACATSSPVNIDDSRGLRDWEPSEEIVFENVWSTDEHVFDTRYLQRIKGVVAPRRGKMEPIAVDPRPTREKSSVGRSDAAYCFPPVSDTGAKLTKVSLEPAVSQTRRSRSAVYVPKCLRESASTAVTDRREVLAPNIRDPESPSSIPIENPIEEIEQIPDTRKCSPVIKMLCRLVAVHCLEDAPRGALQIVRKAGAPVVLEVVDSICIGQNVRCLVFRDLNFSLCESENVPEFRESGGSHLIFAFNWFSPKGVIDYVALGLRMISSNPIDAETGMCGKFFLDKAREFLWHPLFQTLLGQAHPGDVAKVEVGGGGASPADLSGWRGHRDCYVTVTGFSMGGGIAHAFAYQLVEEWGFTQPVRVVCFGSSRPGSDKFARWCESTLEPNSLNVILAPSLSEIEKTASKDDRNDVWHNLKSDPCIKSLSGSGRAFDPVARTPKISDGFGLHPWAYSASHCAASLVALSANERAWLLQRDSEVDLSPKSVLLRAVTSGSILDSRVSKLWTELHSITRYYNCLTDEPL